MESQRPRVVITGAGCLSCVADSPVGLHAALCAGTSGLKAIELFPAESIGGHQAGEIRPFDAPSYLPDRNLRPIDRTSRLLLVAAGQALGASGLSASATDREIGLVLGTTFCSVRTIAEFDRRNLQLGPSYASPFDFANSVINAAAGQTAIWYGLRGLNSTISAGAASGLAALGYATDQIRGGRAVALLAGGAEELCFESFFGHHHPPQRLRPRRGGRAGDAGGRRSGGRAGGTRARRGARPRLGVRPSRHRGERRARRLPGRPHRLGRRGP
jgi:3-oxoacyl-[acyl-carrier-protein] synthase II